MRGGFYIYNKIKKRTTDLVDFNSRAKVSLPDPGINFTLGDEHSFDPVSTNHSASRRLGSRIVQLLMTNHNAPHL